MATSVRWKWFLLPILGIALLAGGVAQLEAGKPKPPPPPPPPVLYGIQFWRTPAPFTAFDLRGSNNLGQVVGSSYVPNAGPFHGFLYDPSLNGDPTLAVDLNALGIAGIPDGWLIRSGQGINDDGVVVGSLQPTDLSDTRMGFILDTKVAPLTLEPLPNPPRSSYWYCRAINNFGDVLVGYRNDTTGAAGVKIYHRATSQWGADAGVNVADIEGVVLSNNGQVALCTSVPTRWTPSTGRLEPIPGTSTGASGINDVGTVCGGTYVQVSVHPSRYQLYPYRYTTSMQVLTSAPSPRPRWISTRTAIWFAMQTAPARIRSYVYHNDLASFYDVDTLIDPNDATDAAIWSTRTGGFPAGITNRIGTTGFGGLVGTLFAADHSYLGYLLTPK